MSTQLAQEDSVIPQWKRELIQRRKCHLVVFANGTNTNNCTVTSSSNTTEGGTGVLPAGPCVLPRQCDSVSDQLAMVEERLSGAGPADADSDSSEELQYGPGIVNKLKCKYLSLALRESRKSRPSVLPLRRATSLDDLLDDDSEVQSVPNDDKTTQRPNRTVVRGNESLKRARSVETLLRCDRKVIPQPVVTEVGSRESFNEDVVIDERPVPLPRHDANKIMSCVQPNKPRRVTPLLSDTERPPPDTVRSALRIFESTMRKARPLKPVGEVALKVATYKHIIAAKKPPVVLPKPSVDTNVITIKPNKPAKPAPIVYGFGSNLGLKPPTSPKNTKLIRTPPVSPKKPVIKLNQDAIAKQDERINLNTSPIIFRSPSPVSPVLLSPKDDLQSPVIQHSTFPVQNGNSNNSPTRQIGVIRPLEPLESEKQKAVEFEKNLKNAEHGVNVSGWGMKKSWHQQSENTVVFNFRNRKDVPDYIENDGMVLKTRRDRTKINESGFILLSDFQSPNSSSTDWDNEDDEDDVTSGNSYDVTSGRHQSGGNTNNSGGNTGGNTNNSGISGNNSGVNNKCDVIFEGAYVIINGKSSLAGNTGRVQPRAKLHIHFDDASTSTYEYPSEASLMEETSPVLPTVPTSPTIIGSASLSSYTPSKHVISPQFELGVTRSSPNTVHEDNTTGSPNINTNTSNSIGANSVGGNGIGLGAGDNNSTTDSPIIIEDYLRPASDDQTISWSQEKIATDLLF